MLVSGIVNVTDDARVDDPSASAFKAEWCALIRWPIDVTDPMQLALIRALATHAAYRPIIRGLGHEMRNPIQAITFAQDLLHDDDGGDDQKLLDAVHRGYDQATGALDLLSEVMDERVEALAPVLVGDVVDWTLRCQKVSDLQTCGQLTSEIDQQIPPVSAHSRDLATALNLAVNNAKEAIGPHGKESIVIKTEVKPNGEGVLIIIEDEGPGLPGRDTEAPFDLFATTKTEPGHLGVGLPAARAVLSTFGSKIRLENASDGGTRCEIWVPEWKRAAG